MEFDEFQHYLDVWFQKRDNTSEYVHPTQKPIKLAERALFKSSKPDDIVADLFGGSGSTLMACEQMKRKARVMELDPKYADVIILRWERFTGQKTVKL
jgi:DNA modification methylase